MVADHNPLLDDIKLPGIITRLPSMGLFYDNGELADDVVNGEVEVHPLGAYEEVLMRSVDHIINGTAIIEVFAKCIPQILKPGELFGKDVDHLLMVLRVATYGPQIEIIHQHTCEQPARTHVIDINTIISQTKPINPSAVATKFALTLPNGQLVEIRPVRFKDVVFLMQQSQSLDTMSNSELQTVLLDSTIRIIHSVNGLTDQAKIEEWARKIPTAWFKSISNSLNDVDHWGPDLGYKTTCPDCGEEIIIEMPLNPLSFFLD